MTVQRFTFVVPFRLNPVLELYATLHQDAGYVVMGPPRTQEEAIRSINEASSPEQRRARKTLNYALLYGAGPQSIQKLLRNPK